MPPEAAARNPFVGPVPFERKDAQLFFGRSGEIEELVSLVVANRVVVLYAASGAGKTSLLNAGVLPLLEHREHFEVLQPARFGRLAADDEAAARDGNVYAYAVLLNWSGGTATPGATVQSFLAALPTAQDARGRRLPRVVVFDQFEEIFTVHPEHWEQREAFFAQLAAALEEDPHLHLVLTLREDYLAQLEPLLPTLLAPHAEDGGERVPGERSHVRYRLDRLGPEAAIEAVIGPVARAGRTFSPGVAEGLVEDLRKLRVDVGRERPIEAPGEFVEPVQLQVVCHSLWQDLPPDVTEITQEHIRAFGDVDEVLERFYDDALAAAARAAHVGEERLRRWLEDAFITSLGTRNMIYRAADSKTTFPDAAIDELEDRHLIRGDWRAGTHWYELTHDRFIAPIQSSNARVAAAASRRRRRRARWVAAAVVPVLAAAAAWGAFARDEPRAGVAVLTARGSLELNVPQEAYRERVDLAPLASRAAGARLGNVVPVALTTQGLRGQRVAVRAVTTDGKDGRLGEPQVVELTISTERAEFHLDLWMPLLPATGRFAYRLSVEDGTETAVAQPYVSGYFRIRREGRSFVATSDNPVFALEVRRSGAGAGRVTSFPTGIDCGEICLSQYDSGTNVSLIAQPRPGSVFRGWRGDCGGRRTCALTVARDVAVVAQFALVPGSKFDVVEAGVPEGAGYRRSPKFDDRASDPPAAEGSRVRVYCYASGERVARRDSNWVKVKVNPDRYLPALFLRHGRRGRPAGVPTC